MTINVYMNLNELSMFNDSFITTGMHIRVKCRQSMTAQGPSEETTVLYVPKKHLHTNNTARRLEPTQDTATNAKLIITVIIHQEKKLKVPKTPI